MNLFNNKKHPFAALAVLFIVIAVYNVVVFIIPFTKGNGFWTGYGFTMLAMLLTAGVGFFTFNREDLRSRVYGIPILSLAWRYLIIQLIIGLVQMRLDYFQIPFQYGFAVNTVLLGAFLIGLITINVAKEEIERIDKKIKEITFYVKSLQVDVESLVNKATDESVKKALKDLAETIRYSDPMSSPQLAAIENKIEAKATALAETVENANDDASKVLCNELQQLFAERNRKCKILK